MLVTWCTCVVDAYDLLRTVNLLGTGSLGLPPTYVGGLYMCMLRYMCDSYVYVTMLVTQLYMYVVTLMACRCHVVMLVACTSMLWFWWLIRVCCDVDGLYVYVVMLVTCMCMLWCWWLVHICYDVGDLQPTCMLRCWSLVHVLWCWWCVGVRASRMISVKPNQAAFVTFGIRALRTLIFIIIIICHCRFFLKVDDDVWVSPQVVLSLMNNHSLYLQRGIGGQCATSNRVNRYNKSKWSVCQPIQ